MVSSKDLKNISRYITCKGYKRRNSKVYELKKYSKEIAELVNEEELDLDFTLENFKMMILNLSTNN